MSYSKIRFAALYAVLVCGGVLLAGPEPGWWRDPSYAIISANPANPPDDYAAVNIGQLKHVATQAKAYLDDLLGLTPAQWIDAYAPHSSPLPFTLSATTDDFAAANVGQAKFIASGFYRILATRAPAYGLQSRLQALGIPNTHYSIVSGVLFPWADPTPSTDNYNLLNIGQLKILFSFDLTAIGPGDSDGDEIPDSWEAANRTNPWLANATSDKDGDGINNLQEYLTNGDPSNSANGAYQLVMRVPGQGWLGVNSTTWTVAPVTPNP